jgi:hypothetical protein
LSELVSLLVTDFDGKESANKILVLRLPSTLTIDPEPVYSKFSCVSKPYIHIINSEAPAVQLCRPVRILTHVMPNC